MVLDAKTKSTLDLIKIAGTIGLKEGKLTIKNCNSKSTLDLMKIVSTYPKNIHLDFVNDN